MYKAIASNKRNTVLIMAVFVGLVGAIGWLAGYALYGENNPSFSVGVIVVAAVYALIQYYAAGKLAVAMTGAKEIKKSDNPRLFRVVENLAITLGITTPKIYIINDPAPNAFATGRNPEHAIVGVTTGLLEIMDDRELEAVMAHEMGHVRNYDIRVSTIAFGLASAIAIISDMALRMMFFGGDRNRSNNSNPVLIVIGIVAIILAPIIAALIQMAVSRQREFLADASGTLTTRDPDAMISALEKLKASSRPMKKQQSAAANLFLVNPLKGGSISKLFSSHPPLEDRIARLRGNTNKF